MIEQKVEYAFSYLWPDRGQINEYFIQQNKIQSDHKILGLGLESADYQFFSLDTGLKIQRPSVSYIHLVKWSTQVNEYTRSIYTFWDFLGDVGGLFDMLKLITEVLIGFITMIYGSELDRVLVQSVFYFR